MVVRNSFSKNKRGVSTVYLNHSQSVNNAFEKNQSNKSPAKISLTKRAKNSEINEI